MQATRMPQGYWIPLGIVLISLLVVFTGGFVRINDAGESCPDWPKCFDSWGFYTSAEEQAAYWEDNQDQIDSRGPEHRYSTFEIFTEWFHRFLVGIALIPICLLNLIAVKRSDNELESRVHLLAVVLFVLLILQALAGAVTVKFDNADWSVALHLTLALIFMSASIFQALLWAHSVGKLPKFLYIASTYSLRFRRRISNMVGILFSVLFIGAWLATSDGGSNAASCSIGWVEGWPLCQGELIPTSSSSGTHLQMTHRLAVVFAIGYIGFGIFKMRSEENQSIHVLTTILSTGLAIMILNSLVGGAYVIMANPDGFPEWLSLTHLILATISFLVVVLALLLTYIDDEVGEVLESE